MLEEYSLSFYLIEIFINEISWIIRLRLVKQRMLRNDIFLNGCDELGQKHALIRGWKK